MASPLRPTTKLANARASDFLEHTQPESQVTISPFSVKNLTGYLLVV
eukprot:CAMPEP_0115030110 /NCGR_PEP_ID=MMETSP0216-20121206/37518_1 /TAXON_ID=223996 /ORGANISM="Protocruzia adherens, Strain Boccale" /LENGTH=46 /DNA_ID= /DNA_START= /DNA_END= /DNA_ORIENTATION=